MNSDSHNRSVLFLAGWQSFLCFTVIFAARGVWEEWGVPHFWIISASVTSAINALVIRNLLWLGPVTVCLLCKTPVKWPLRSLFSRRIPWAFVFCCSCAMLVVLHTIWLLTWQGSSLIMSFSLAFVLTEVCAGITEELLFRGFLLNSALAVYPAPAAVVITGVYFVLIHFTPLLFGAPLAELFSIRGLQIFLMGSFFSVVLQCHGLFLWPLLIFSRTNLRYDDN